MASENQDLVLADHVECGVVMIAQDRPKVLDLARRVEAGGFDSIWMGDHISFYVPLLESLSLLSFLAAATERVPSDWRRSERVLSEP